MPPIYVTITPENNYYQLVVLSGWINNWQPIGLKYTNGIFTPSIEEFAPLVQLIDPYLPEIKKVIENGEYKQYKQIRFPLQTDGWVK